jgi:hypothetical protein
LCFHSSICYYVIHRDQLNLQTGRGTQPTSYSVATRSSLARGKAAKREADCSGPSNVEVKNVWLCFICNEAHGQVYLNILWLLTVV